jgi:hypothetical protein
VGKLFFLLTTSQKHILKYDDSTKGWMRKGWVNNYELLKVAFLIEKGVFKVAYLIEKGVFKVAYLTEKGMSDFKFKQFEHAQVKVEQARGVGRKLCMRNNSDSLKMIFTKGSGEEKGAGAQVLFLREKAHGSSCFGKGRMDLLASGKGAWIFLLRERAHGSFQFL